MKQIHKILLFAVSIGAMLPASAMPIGLRTAVWGVSAANGRTAVARLLPETGNPTEIKAALKSFSDKAVEANIADDSEYEEFREWALESGARADALADSPTAWLSFALGLPVLAAELQEGDLVVDGFAPAGENGAMEMVFSLANVAVGRQALASRLQSVFGVVGAATPDKSKFSGSNLSYSLSATEDGKVKAVVTPKTDGDGDPPASFFMQVKMK